MKNLQNSQDLEVLKNAELESVLISQSGLVLRCFQEHCDFTLVGKNLLGFRNTGPAVGHKIFTSVFQKESDYIYACVQFVFSDVEEHLSNSIDPQKVLQSFTHLSLVLENGAEMDFVASQFQLLNGINQFEELILSHKDPELQRKIPMIPREILVPAMVGCSELTLEKILRNLSKSARISFLEDLSRIGVTKKSGIEPKQARISVREKLA